jgi:hypothetical protein
MNTHDVISQADLYGGHNASLTTDRFGKSQSAIALNNGYYKMPAGVYFNSSFSFMAWVKLREITYWSRIMDVANQGPVDNVAFALNKEISGGITSLITSGTYWGLTYPTTTKFTLNSWQHVAFVLNYPTNYLYLNGNLMATATSTILPRNVIRRYNFVGKSTFPGDSYAVADLDEIKIFNRALTQQQVQFEMTNEIFN